MDSETSELSAFPDATYALFSNPLGPLSEQNRIGDDTLVERCLRADTSKVDIGLPPGSLSLFATATVVT